MQISAVYQITLSTWKLVNRSDLVPVIFKEKKSKNQQNLLEAFLGTVPYLHFLQWSCTVLEANFTSDFQIQVTNRLFKQR